MGAPAYGNANGVSGLARVRIKSRLSIVRTDNALAEKYRTWIEGALETAKAAADIVQKHKVTK